MVQKLDEVPKKNIADVLPYKDYDQKDINDAADLIEKMLRWVPAERISCSEALKHKFFKGVECPLSRIDTNAGQPKHKRTQD